MLPALAADCERLQGAATAAVALAERRRDLDRARVDAETARAAHNDAKERVLDLRERRLAGMAAELAGQLTDGHPCAVCGSAEHPDPAQPAESAVSKDAEEAASAEERAAEAARDKVLARIAELEREIEGLTARGGDADPVELAAALRTATLRYEDAGELADQSATASAELDRLRAEEADLHDQPGRPKPAAAPSPRPSPPPKPASPNSAHAYARPRAPIPPSTAAAPGSTPDRRGHRLPRRRNGGRQRLATGPGDRGAGGKPGAVGRIRARAGRDTGQSYGHRDADAHRA